MSRTDVTALARLLDGDPTGNGEVSEQIDELATLARTLQAAAVRPSPMFAADLRAHLLEQARAQSVRPPLLTRLRRQPSGAAPRWRYSVRLAAVSAVASLALSGGAVATAAERSLPSDPLYGVKLALEEARLALTADAAARGTQRLAYAVERLDDARREAQTGDFQGAAGGLREADESARSGARDLIRASQQRHDSVVLEVLENFTRLQRRRLAALAPLLAGPADEAAQQVLVTLQRIDERLAVLQGDCGGCDEPAAAPSDGAFDFAEIPPAAAPFVSCPCASARTGREQPRGRDRRDDPSAKQARERRRRPAEAGDHGRQRSSPAAPSQQPSAPSAPPQQPSAPSAPPQQPSAPSAPPQQPSAPAAPPQQPSAPPPSPQQPSAPPPSPQQPSAPSAPPQQPRSQPPRDDGERESADEPPTTAEKPPTNTDRPPVAGDDAGSDTTTTLEAPAATLRSPADGDAQSGDPVEEVVEDVVEDVVDALSGQQPADEPRLPAPSAPAPSVGELASELPNLP